MSCIAGLDVGATRARARIVESGAAPVSRTLETARYGDAEALLRDALNGVAPQALCIAVAGPVMNGAACLTNGGLRFEAGALRRALGIPDVELVNDLEAFAAELRHLEGAQLMQIGTAARKPGASAALAPGTGLGMALLAANGQPIPSEGGHAPLAPADPLEQALLGILARNSGYVSWEDVLSGPGLANLYNAVCEVWGSVPQALDASEITASATTLADPICHQTLETWCAILGSAAGALCVTACTVGGVYIGGGIVPRIAEFVADSGFRRRFEERGKMSDYAKSAATLIVKDDAVGLAGAVRRAQALTRRG